MRTIFSFIKTFNNFVLMSSKLSAAEAQRAFVIGKVLNCYASLFTDQMALTLI